MTYQVLENGVIRDATAEEVADIEERKAAALQVQPTPMPTKEQLMAEIEILTEKIKLL